MFPGVARWRQTEIDNIGGFFSGILNGPKPMIVALNGPAYGGGATHVTLCDKIVAHDSVEMSFPFKKWHVVPEGCSSTHLSRLCGVKTAEVLLGGWIPIGKELLNSGLINILFQQS